MIPKTMKAAQLSDWNTIEINEVPVPEPGRFGLLCAALLGALGVRAVQKLCVSTTKRSSRLRASPLAMA